MQHSSCAGNSLPTCIPDGMQNRIRRHLRTGDQHSCKGTLYHLAGRAAQEPVYHRQGCGDVPGILTYLQSTHLKTRRAGALRVPCCSAAMASYKCDITERPGYAHITLMRRQNPHQNTPSHGPCPGMHPAEACLAHPQMLAVHRSSLATQSHHQALPNEIIRRGLAMRR